MSTSVVLFIHTHSIIYKTKTFIYTVLSSSIVVFLYTNNMFPEYKSHTASVTITGDFNHVNLDSTVPTFHQFVDCTTWEHRALDFLFANIKDVYRATALPPLGKSDHDLILLTPQYVPAVQR